MDEQIIARRSVLKYFGILAATSAGREFLQSWLSPSKTEAADAAAVTPHSMHHAQAQSSAAPYHPQFFNPHEFETVETLSDIIIPRDETPGAKEARVADYIDFVVFSAAEFKPGLQQQWTAGLALLDKLSKRQYGSPFTQITAGQREALLEEISLPERDSAKQHAGFEFYRLVKEMTVEGFYTSRVGLIDVLGYKGLTFLSDFPGCTHPEHQS